MGDAPPPIAWWAAIPGGLLFAGMILLVIWLAEILAVLLGVPA
jgi:hypothetical protein